MAPQDLKNSISQLAMQGRLVEQRPEEGSAEELYCQIQEEKERLIKEKKIKKEKPLPEVRAEEEPFEIPETWKWVRLGSICTIARGSSPRPIKEYITTADDGVNWIKIGDAEKNRKYIISTAEKIKPAGVSKSRMVHSGDFLLTNSMSFGHPYILKIDGCIHDGWLVISQPAEIFDQDYLYWMLSSGYAYSQFCSKASGSGVKNLNIDKVANSVFPLPPLEEQKRVAEKLDELIPLCDRYEKTYDHLHTLDSRFPSDIRKSILQEVMQGRLVEQRPEEGSAEELYCQIQEEKERLIKEEKIKKEKPLPEVRAEEEPFEIPETWKWVRLGEIIPIKMGQSPKGTTVSETIEGIEFHQGKIFFGNKYIKHSPQKSLLAHVLAEPNSVLLSVRAPVGKVNITDREIGVGRGLACLSCPPGIDVDFIFYLLSSYEKIFSKQATGTTFLEINRKVIENQPIPLPPLGEQKRIVNKLDELLALCSQLEGRP